MSKLLQLLADPDRMHSGLHGHSRRRQIDKPLLYGLGRGSETSSIDYFAVFVEAAVMAPDISKIDTDRQLNLDCLRGTSAMRCCVVFFMGTVSLRSERPAHPICRYRSAGRTDNFRADKITASWLKLTRRPGLTNTLTISTILLSGEPTGIARPADRKRETGRQNWEWASVRNP